MKHAPVRTFQKCRVPEPRESVPFKWPSHLSLSIEIGCGVGYHPLHYSRQNPDRFLVAIERTEEKFQKFWRRYINHGQPGNLLPVHDDAVSWITHQIGESQVEEYFILYPNPYPKRAQANKRWVHMPFTEYLILTLKERGRITLATNERFYFDEAAEGFSKIWGLKVIEAEMVNAHSAYRTHFERKYLQRGDTCYQLVLEKPSQGPGFEDEKSGIRGHRRRPS